MATLAQLEKEIALIKERNRKVEANKAWETSWARRIAIVVLTYAVTSIVFASIGVPKPFENALVPTVAFLLSTLTLEAFKGIWIKGRK
ncbi:Uncharacterised protein [Candidatus Anstonella stagnisolia]|nr:Uncharacterised protein [Candidatus Anstonella stagnisolia]